MIRSQREELLNQLSQQDPNNPDDEPLIREVNSSVIDPQSIPHETSSVEQKSQANLKSEFELTKEPQSEPRIYTFKHFIYDLEAVLALIFIIGAFLSQTACFSCIILKSIFALWRRNFLKFDRDRFRALIKEENFHSILFVGLILIFQNKQYNGNFLSFLLFPNMLSFGISFCEWGKSKEHFSYRWNKENIDWLLLYKYDLSVKKCYIELWLFLAF
jgi:hypothetical protein